MAHLSLFWFQAANYLVFFDVLVSVELEVILYPVVCRLTRWKNSIQEFKHQIVILIIVKLWLVLDLWWLLHVYRCADNPHHLGMDSSKMRCNVQD